MDYIELTIRLPREKVDLVSTFLVAGGYDVFEICDKSDLSESAGAMFGDYIEPDLLREENAPPEIRFYLDGAEIARAEEIRDYLLSTCEKLGETDVSCEIRMVENSDWDTRWKQFFYPFPVGERLFILPSWEKEPPEAAGRKIIRIDPAAAFGTGTHATTRLCLEEMESHLKKGDRVLDMGCGSGILGIGAKLLGAGDLSAVDIDEAAVRITRENLEKNGFSADRVTLVCGNVLEDEAALAAMGSSFDLICANIVAGIIQKMAPILHTVLKPGGILLASGILESRKEEVEGALTSLGFTLLSARTLDEWVCLTLTK